MKHTKSMIYKWSEDANDIYLSFINEGDFYRGRTMGVIENLKKKANKGIYTSEKAIDIYYTLVNEYLTRFYYKQWCSPGFVFPVGTRYTVAVEIEKYYKEQCFEEVTK